MEFIELNKFTSFHNGNTIIFCKTDFILEEFEYIKKLDNNVILITGNSDYPITDNHINLLPSNVKLWYAQNALSNSNKLIPLPLGLENKLPSKREGHGIGYYDRVDEKETLLKRNIIKEPYKFIYSNFNIFTNINKRLPIKNISIQVDFIDWDDNNLTLTEYFNKILDYKMILCPVGNGIDTHRLWEVLYSNRIPITVKDGDYNIYNLYNKLPIIVLNDINELYDKNKIEYEYNKIINKKINNDILNYYYWEELIKKTL